MSNNEEIYNYYQRLAKRYDRDRFDNSYGRYIHQQETELLDKLLKDTERCSVLDLACGTGRHLTYAEYGVDISPNMIDVATKKYPDAQLIVADAADTRFPANCFDTVIAFHLLMHLPDEKIKSILTEAHRILKKQGRFIVDFPSAKRRRLFARKRNDWHGNTCYRIDELRQQLGENWTIKSVTGILFLPVHRLPKKIRRFFIRLDNLLCRSRLKEYASYLVVELQRNDT